MGKRKLYVQQRPCMIIFPAGKCYGQKTGGKSLAELCLYMSLENNTWNFFAVHCVVLNLEVYEKLCLHASSNLFFFFYKMLYLIHNVPFLKSQSQFL